jgi:hypothetical protein
MGVSTNSILNVADLHFEVVDTASKVHNAIHGVTKISDVKMESGLVDHCKLGNPKKSM